MFGDDRQEAKAAAASFATTHWSVVLAAGGEPLVQADQALCGSYWPSLTQPELYNVQRK